MILSKGDKAPNFTLRDTNKNEISLSDYSGKNVLILFFPLAFSGPCTEELCTIRDENAIYGELDVEILAISVDSIFSLAKFKDEQQYEFVMLSDFNKEVARSYGALYDEFVFGMKGVAKRSAFVVDHSGTLQYAEVSKDAGNFPDFDKIKTILKELKK